MCQRRRHLPSNGSVQFENLSSALCTFGVSGPDAPAILSAITDTPLSHAAFRHGALQEVLIDGVPATMLRSSYVSESGWKIHTSTSQGARPVGIGVYGTTGRLEKGYALMGTDLNAEYSPLEAGLARPRVKAAEFIGKPACLKDRAEGPAARLCTLTMDSHTSASGMPGSLPGAASRS